MSEEPKVLKSVKEEVLEIYGFKFRSYILEDGSRVFNAEDVEKFFSEKTNAH